MADLPGLPLTRPLSSRAAVTSTSSGPDHSLLGSHVTVPTNISAPVIPLPGTRPAPAVAPAYVDGIPIALAVPPVSPRGKRDRHHRFWSSAPRPASSTISENYYISTGKPKRINYISFDLAHFPHQVAIYWMNSSGGWSPVTWANGTPVVVVINGSVPAVVNNHAAMAAGLNPFHYGAGHWVHFEEDIAPISTTQLLFTMNRAFAAGLPQWQPPADAAGHQSPYPLAVRDLDFGWIIRDRGDVPWTPRHPVISTERLPFDDLDDVHGSPMTVAIRENRATDLLSGGTWRSAPQLRTDAVVSLYVDSRSPSGAAQVIDRFYLQPVTSGVRVNLYYASQAPPAGSVFQSVDAPLLAPNITTGGSQLPAPTPTGLLFPNTSTSLTITSAAAGISGSQPWWAAFSVQPQFPSTDPGSYIIVDIGIFQLYFSGGAFIVTTALGNAFARWNVTFAASDTITFAVVFDGLLIHVWIASQSTTTVWGQMFGLPASNLPPVPAISLGGALPSTATGPQLIANPNFGGGLLTGWAPFNGTIVTVNNAPSGGPQPWAVLFTPNGTTQFGALEGSAVGGPFAAVPGVTYTVTVSVYPVITPPVPVVLEIGFDWQNSSQIYLVTTTKFISPVAGQWTSYTVPIQAPLGIGVAFGYPRAGWNGQGTNVPANALLYIEQVQVTGPSTFAAMKGNFNLRAMVVKQERLDLSQGLPAVWTQFASDPDSFVYPLSGPQSGDTTQNSCVRFHPNFILGTVNPYGFVGGVASAYAACSWTPILADYTLAAGFMEFDPVLASVFKFEFTSLAPEPFDYIEPVTKHFKQLNAPPPAPVSKDGNRGTIIDNGVRVNQATAPLVGFADSPLPQQPHAGGTSLPREVLHATTPHGADVLGKQGGSLYNFQKWKPEKRVPKNDRAGPHAYGEADLQVRGRIAYFVAISQLTMYRVNYSAQDDAEEYTDYFGDLANTTPAAPAVPAVQWTFTPGFLTAPGGLTTFAQIQSNIFPSDHTVTGIQFASTQSDPVQILADPDFAQPGIPQWQGTGDALPVTIATSINTQLGAMVQVTRSAQGHVTTQTVTQQVPQGVQYTWAQLTASFQTWATLQSAVSSWSGFWHTVFSTAQYQVAIPAASYYGGIQTINPVTVTGAGRIYAAARVWSPIPLSQPLALQILDGLTGTVLAEADNPVQGGVVTEWFVGYTLGSADLTQSLTWNQVTNNFPTWNSFGSNSWFQVDTSVLPLGQSVNVRVIQRGITADTWFVDNISLFEQSIVWNFSNDGGASFTPAYDIRNNPNGVLMFPPPKRGTGNQLVWQLQGWRPGLTVSSLIIRPWYTTKPSGHPPRIAGIGHGPNLTPTDYYNTLDKDPHWRAWALPIPQTWFFAYQQIAQETSTFVPVPQPVTSPAGLVLGSGLALTAASQLPPPPPPKATYIDMFVDVYTETYGIAEAGDVYTDIYDDVYGQDYTSITGTLSTGTAALQAASTLTAGATNVPALAPLEGAAVGFVPGNGIAVSSFIATTAQPLALRRIYMGNQIPLSVASSLISYDAAAGRKVSIDFRPDATTTPAQLDAFLTDCVNNGVNAEISLWANPQTGFINPQDYFAIVSQYYPVIHKSGYSHIFVISNTNIVQGGLSTWYPGDTVVDGISASFFAQGPPPGDKGAPTLAYAANFAALHGKPFGLSEFGADWSLNTVAQGQQFLNYVLRFVRAQLAARRPMGDFVYLSASTFNLTDAPASWITIYRQISSALAGH